MSYVGQVKVGSTTHLVGSTLYGTCATAAGTAAKVGTLANFDALITGVTIHLKFSYANTAANPTLNVNNTGAKPLVKYGTTRAGATDTASWYAGSVVALTYDGTSWVINDFKENTNTTYSAGTNLTLTGTTFAIKESPAFTGVPTSPTNATASTSTTQIATTAFTQAAIRRRLPPYMEIVPVTNVTVNNNTQTKVQLLTDYPNCVIIGSIQVQFPTNATGMRWLQPCFKQKSLDWTDMAHFQRTMAVSGAQTMMTTPIVISKTTDNDIHTIGCTLYQNSGTNMTGVNVTLRYYKIIS